MTHQIHTLDTGCNTPDSARGSSYREVARLAGRENGTREAIEMDMTITNQQIVALEDEAAIALDHVQVGLCRIARGAPIGRLNLTDSERARLRNTTRSAARKACIRAIESTQAVRA